jgi:malate dehydrogenase
MFIGVPVKLGREGIKEIIEIELNDAEKAMMKESAQHVQDNLDNLERIEKENA